MKTSKKQLQALTAQIAKLSGIPGSRAEALNRNWESYLTLSEGFDNYYALNEIMIPNGTVHNPFYLANHSYKAGEMSTFLRGIIGTLTNYTDAIILEVADKISRTPELNAFAALLLRNHFTLIVYKDKVDYFHFAKDDKIGFVEFDKWRGFKFTTVNKPTREIGTGFQFSDFSETADVATAIACCNCTAPKWATRSQKELAVDNKWESVSAFVKGDTILKRKALTF